MISRSLAGVVSQAPLFRYDRVGACRQHNVCGQTLLFENLVGFIRNDICTGDVDLEGPCPLAILQISVLVR